MRKILSILLVLVLIISLTACKRETTEDKISRAEDLIDDEKFDDARDLLEEIMDSEDVMEFDGLILQAWNLLVETDIEEEEFKDAEKTLEKYYEFVLDNKDDIDVDEAIDAITDYAKDLKKEEVEFGKWYSELMPDAPDLSSVMSVYIIGESLELDIPDGMEMLYTMDGSDPTKDGNEFKDAIAFDEEGVDLLLTAVYRNELGIYGDATTVWLSIVREDAPEDIVDDIDPDNPDGDVADQGPVELVPVEVDLASGNYEGITDLKVTNYDLENSENITIYYTYDGQDPSVAGNYYWSSITLTAGEYTIGLCAYNYDTGEYSEPSYFEYYIQNDDAIKVGFYDIPTKVITRYRYLFDTLAWYDIIVEPIIYNDLAEVNPLDLPDAVITYATYAEDMAPFGVITDVSKLVDFNDYDYYADALEAGYYDDTYYVLPLTIKPEYLLFGDYTFDNPPTWEELQGEPDWSDYRMIYGADNPRLLLGIYYGLGGEPIDTINGNVQLNRDILIEAIQLVIDMPSQGIGTELYPYDIAYNEMIDYNAEVALLFNDSEPDDYSYALNAIGGMPLPDGGQAKYYNLVTGMMISSTTAVNPNRLAKVLEFYDALATNEYDLNGISDVEESLPVFYHQAMTGNSYSDIEEYQYVEIVENGITTIRSLVLFDLYDSMIAPLAEILNGASAASIADAIISATKQ